MTIELLSDDELVTRARSGCGDAFSELVRRNSNASKKLAASVLRDVTEAEDALQDAWSKAWQHVANFQGDSKFSTWFTRIVLNQCLMRLRSSKRRPVVALDESSGSDDRPSIAMRTPDLAPSPEEILSSREIRRLVRREVAMMPPLLRDPLVMRDLDQLPIEIVAGRLAVSVPAVKSRLLRARAELKKRLARHVTGVGSLALASAD